MEAIKPNLNSTNLNNLNSNNIKNGTSNFSDFSISYERVSVSANYLMERTMHRPKIAIICGSGLG